MVNMDVTSTLIFLYTHIYIYTYEIINESGLWITYWDLGETVV